MGSFFSKPKTKVQSVSTLTPYQQQLVEKMGNFLTPMIGQPGASYSGQRVADLSPIFGQTFNMANDLAGSLGGYQQIAKEALSGLGSGAWAQPVVDWTKSLWSDTIMPSIMERQGGMDAAGSGGTTAALSKGGQQLALGMNAQLAPLMQQGQMASAQLAGQIPGQFANTMGQLGNIGGLQQGYSQDQLNAAMQAWQEQQPMNNQVWSMLPMLLGQQTENIAKQQSGGLGYSALSGLLGTEAGAGGILKGLGALGGFLGI